MSATAHTVGGERTDARSAIRWGLQIGILTALAVVMFVKGGELVGTASGWFRVVVVFTAGCSIAFLPARWVGVRTGDGIAAAALVGLVGTAVFSIVDVALLRVIDLYPWTWDAIGGSSGWWYLPVWWMLGTLIAWMGALVVAGEAARGRGGIASLVGGTLAGTAGLAVVGLLITPLGFGPVLVGGAFVVAIGAWAVLQLARAR